jgi:CRISPR-associated endonuclease/helicase Cas3
MALIQSHIQPYKSLQQHVNEVFQASKMILAKHSKKIQNQIFQALELTVKFHDMGKATPEFQKYINAPWEYTGDRKLKAHTPVSLLLWLLFARDNNIPKDIILLVSTAVWRHHGDFPTFKSLIYKTLYEYEEDFQIAKYPLAQVCKELDLTVKLEPEDADFELEDLLDRDFIDLCYLEEAAGLKIKAQLLFSILIESDRTFLALSDEFLKQKLDLHQRIKIRPDTVDSYLLQKIALPHQNDRLNQDRTLLRKQIIGNSNSAPGIESVTLPTGLGKTLIGAQWALTHRGQGQRDKKVIIVLPFLSIIDQTVKEYKKLFSCLNTDSLILEAHSIAQRNYVDDAEEERNNEHNNAIDFYAETWNFDFVITTFDQFLYSLLSSKKNYLMKFHNFADSLIIIDEIQALPTKLWQPLVLALGIISKELNTKILIMSATQPAFLQTRELVNNPGAIFKNQNRYHLILKHKTEISLKDFIQDCIVRIERENWNARRVLIVLNTRASARKVIDSLEKHINCDTYFLSADVTPKERLGNIEKIKDDKPCVVVATQCIEAGVDIDMDFVIRDFAPLDSIIQCAGRCNRNARRQRANVEIVALLNRNGRKFSGSVYDATLLEKTAMILNIPGDEIPEEEIFSKVSEYFKTIKATMDTGREEAEEWAYWKTNLDIKKLLRNNNEKYDFIVASQDIPLQNELFLKDAILKAMKTNDVWDRKRELRKLKSRISKLTISIWATAELDPLDVSEKIGCYYFLKDEFYKPGRGIDISALNNDSQDSIF